MLELKFINNRKIVFLAGTFYPGLLDCFINEKIKPLIFMLKNEDIGVRNYYYKNYDENLVFIVETQDELVSDLENQNPDIIISLGWKKILKYDFFNKFASKQLINIHPALLPEYKGYHTEPYVIFNNEIEHGITAHVLTEDLDAGDIILQKRFSIHEYDTVNSLKRKVDENMPSFIKEFIEILNGKREIKLFKQCGNTKITAPKRKPSDSEINPEYSLNHLYNTLRAFDAKKYPAFFTREDGVKVFIKIWTNRPNKLDDEL